MPRRNDTNTYNKAKTNDYFGRDEQTLIAGIIQMKFQLMHPKSTKLKSKQKSKNTKIPASCGMLTKPGWYSLKQPPILFRRMGEPVKKTTCPCFKEAEVWENNPRLPVSFNEEQPSPVFELGLKHFFQIICEVCTALTFSLHFPGGWWVGVGV